MTCLSSDTLIIGDFIRITDKKVAQVYNEPHLDFLTEHPVKVLYKDGAVGVPYPGGMAIILEGEYERV